MPVTRENRQKIAIITQSRAEIFFMARLLAAGLTPDVMADKHDPLLVSVRGSIGSGKKIIPDAMREYFLGTTALGEVTGRPGYDEFWRGQVRGQQVEFAYIDAAWQSGYSNPEFVSPYIHHVREAFMATREHGGIAFVHNDYTLGINRSAGLDIWMEKQGQPNPDGERPRAHDGPLQKEFRTANKKDPENDWVRYIEIEVADKRLLASPKFGDVLDKLRNRHRGVKIKP